jgi:hypothetical protein
MLVHFLSKHQLYVDLNAFKEFEFEAHVYHKEGRKEQNPATEVYETNSFSKSATHRRQDTLLINET